MLTISDAQFAALQDLNFNVGSNTFTLNANAQIWPRALNSVIGGNPGQIYLVASDVSSASFALCNVPF
jgi:saccharopepsin